MKLTKQDWENCKKAAEGQIKQGMIDQAIGENLLEKANKELKNFPDDKPKINPAVV